MEERCLKRIAISTESGEALFNDIKELKGIELWNSKSKIVNENIRNISKPLKFISLVNPIHTPIWAIIDKPYNVFSTNENTLMVFQTLVNYSEIEENVSSNAILTSITNNLFMLFYIEVLDQSLSVKCLLLEINFNKINEILSRQDVLNVDSPSYFIDEVMTKKDEMIDTLLKQRNDKVQTTRMKKQQSEDSVKDQQLRIINTRQNFKKIINKEVKRRMASRSKASQIEVGEICFKSMSFKFRGLEKLDDRDEKEIKDWLNVFLSVLGV